MLNNAYMEMQTNKRFQRFLLHKSTEENMDAIHAKLVIRTDGKSVFTILLNQNKIVKYLPIREITAFFGKQHDAFNTQAIITYLDSLATVHAVEIIRVNVVICETKGKVGTHLFIDTRYKEALSTVDFLTHFNKIN
jgi:hypothetical protein